MVGARFRDEVSIRFTRLNCIQTLALMLACTFLLLGCDSKREVQVAPPPPPVQVAPAASEAASAAVMEASTPTEAAEGPASAASSAVAASVGSGAVLRLADRYANLPDFASATRLQNVEVTGMRLSVRNAQASADGPRTAQSAALEQPVDDKLAPLWWNAWLGGGGSNSPLMQPRIEPKRPYTVQLDLAAFQYQLQSSSSAGQGTSSGFETLLKKAAARGQKSLDLEVVLIHDGAFFDWQQDSDRVQQVSVDVDKLKELTQKVRQGAPDARLETTAALKGLSDYVLKRVSFPMRSKEQFPREAKYANLAVSIWDRETQIPVDEVSFAVCASARCNGVELRSSLFAGLDLLRKGSPPLASIHLIEVGNQYLYGVFARPREATASNGNANEEKGRYVSWIAEGTFSDLDSDMENLSKVLSSSDEANRPRKGASVFSTLVSSELARNTIERALRGVVQGEPYRSNLESSVYFRVAARGSLRPVLWPLGLLAVDAGESKGYRFLGRYARIESPLSVQADDGASVCAADWVVVGPARDGATGVARSRLGATGIGRLGPFDNSLRVGGSQVEIVDSMDEFFKFIHGPLSTVQDPQPPLPRSNDAQILTVLSHHDRGRVYFDDLGQGSSVDAKNVRRVFSKPSAVILNGCSTAGRSGPGSSDLLDSLNRRGIDAAIATVSEVQSEMAGDFLDCFLEQVEEAGEGGLPIGVAHMKTLQCLEKRESANGPAWGSLALLYGVLGNSALRICSPASTLKDDTK